MEERTAHHPHRALRAARIGLGIARFALIVVSVFAAILLPIGVFGRSTTITLDAELDEPYTIVFGTANPGFELTDPYIGVVDGNSTTIGNVDDWPADLGVPRSGAPTVRLAADVADDDLDTRIVGSVLVGILIGLAWLVFVPTRRLVDDAASGRPFHSANPTRLRTIAAALAAGKVVSFVGVRVLDATLDSPVPVRLVDSFPGWWTTAAVVIAVLVLAEVFHHGAELQELDDLTV